ncbi:hypothetical protein H8B15_05070 [Hymenobacter sp. BT507]|uniref:STAS/SEC14 domain-containing protein n=1 Tax=Hymenobacter citatus TaxID=2763506 RepID=A0ABR7MH61_9BACT|nr:hypothetical protein [Hymenobacter citatus]MBC6610278.1 hypothetical protein [Hymenobacter citatus]
MIYRFPCVTVLFDANLRLLWWKWVDASKDVAFKEVFEQLLQLSDELKPFRWLADVSSLPAVSLIHQHWLSESWLPQYRRLHIQALAILLPSSLHNQLALENLVDNALPTTHCDMQYFTEVLAALDWLALMDEECAAQLHRQWLAAV